MLFATGIKSAIFSGAGISDYWVYLVLCAATLGVLAAAILNHRFYRSTKYSELLLNLSPCAIFAVDRKRRIVAWNRKAESVTGYSAKEVLGKSCTLFAGAPCGESCGLFGGDAGAAVESQECAIVRKDGIMRVISKNAGILKDQDGTVIGAVESFEDITERKKSMDAMKQAVQIKSAFVTMVSHELRTPMAAIKEGIALMSEEIPGPLNTDQKEFLGIVKNNVDRLARLINDVLDFERLESGRVPLRLERTDLNVVVEEVARMMQPVAKRQGLGLTFEADGSLPQIFMDRDRIVQVISNLVNNALKFTEEGGIRLKTEMLKDEVAVIVSDTGHGIPQYGLLKIFGAFEQIEPGYKPGGAGLGLAICKQLVEAHGGYIGVSSADGKGSKFYFTLPLRRDKR